MRSVPSGLVVGLAVVAGAVVVRPGRAGAADNPLARRARGVLQTHCGRCHGPDGRGKGGFNYVLDRDRLVARGQVVPGHADESKLYRRVRDGEMPPPSVKARPSPGEVALLRRWVEAGAPAVGPAAAPRTFLTEADVVRLLAADLRALPPRQRRFARYFSLANLYDAGVPDEQLEAARHALAKLVNSLSWHPRVTAPRAIDPDRTVFRVDLRALRWDARLWNRLLEDYPYRFPPPSAEFKAVAAATASELPYVRADWFVATASRAPLYYDLLRLPSTDRELERQLRVDALQDIRDDDVARAGFNGSGVSRNNRLIERHDAAFGAYWRSYDFAGNSGRQNLFEHPLGPEPGRDGFEHAGGEIIFHLPNGLQGYLLVDGAGRRLDRAPVAIVSDPRRPERAVEAGLSCMTCHAGGLIFKADQVRAHVRKNPTAFRREDAATVRALYVPEAKFKALVEEDARRFRKALARAGVPAAGPEPVADLTRRYEGEVDLAAAAGELGLRPDDFLRRLGRSSDLARALGPLRVRGGAVQRQVFQELFAELVRRLRPGEATAGPRDAAALDRAAGPEPFAGHAGHALCLAFAPDGKRALSGGEDGTVRLWDVAEGRLLRTLRGHAGEVRAVAFAADGKRALSGGADRTVRCWDLEAGREACRLEGHTDRVNAVALAPDGRHALSGGADRAVIVWDLRTGREVRRLSGHEGAVTAVAVAPDGKRVLSAGHDGTVRLWDVSDGRELRVLTGSGREVYALAFAPDGRFALSGGNDRLVRLWDLEGGREVRRFEGHTRAVVRVAFTPDGKRVLSGDGRYRGSGPFLRLWDRASGKELRAFGAAGGAVWCLAFAPDGRRALSGGADDRLRAWELSP